MSDFTFAQVPTADIPRSSFNRSHGHKTTFNAGYLIPIYIDEALPGDTFKVNVHMFARLGTPIFPIMDNLHLDVFFFAVPNRLVWRKWQRFCGEQENPGDSTDYEIPQVDAGPTGFAEGSIFDYFGLPLGIPNMKVCAFWSRAYNLIYNEWFRDENLCLRAPMDASYDGPDNAIDFQLMKRGKRHDYFTSCLPWPQKGEGVELPLGSSAPVIPTAANIAPTFAYSGDPNDVSGLKFQSTGSDSSLQPVQFPSTVNSAVLGDLFWKETGLIADLNSAISVTINSLRQAFQIQKLLERDARGGTRYTEILRSHFGVMSPDARLQRPEYLGGGSFPVIVNPVAQTSGSVPTESPQGNLAAFAQANGSNGFSKSFVEHSVIVGLIMARADLSYQQGTHRMFNRKTRYDFYWPAFAHLGEQAVTNGEIYSQGEAVVDPATGKPMDESVFGYQERWAEYRYFPSRITGKFRSTVPDTLDAWHLAQEFSSLPVLGQAFIEENPPVDRVIAVTSAIEPQFIFDSHFKIQCTRPMPAYSVPGLIDHF